MILLDFSAMATSDLRGLSNGDRSGDGDESCAEFSVDNYDKAPKSWARNLLILVLFQNRIDCHYK